MNLLVDTNILIDYVCRRGEFYEPACKVFATAFVGKHKIMLTDLSYINCIYVAKHYNVDSTKLLKALLAIQEVSILANVDDKVLKAALLSDWKDKEDALQYYAALASNAEAIVTRNPKDFQNSTIPVIQPVEF